MPCDFHWLAIIQRLDFREHILISLDKICELIEEFGPFETSYIFPPCGVESIASSRDGYVNVLRRA